MDRLLKQMVKDAPDAILVSGQKGIVRSGTGEQGRFLAILQMKRSVNHLI